MSTESSEAFLLPTNPYMDEASPVYDFAFSRDIEKLRIEIVATLGNQNEGHFYMEKIAMMLHEDALEINENSDTQEALSIALNELNDALPVAKAGARRYIRSAIQDLREKMELQAHYLP